MRPTDRLFALVQLVRGRRLSTAAYLAERLQVSLRTVYRDIAQLQYQGIPIEGEAGVGYRLGKGYELSPLMFTQDEANALLASIRLAQAWLDPKFALAAEDSLGKILSILPEAARRSAENVPLYLAPLQSAKMDAATLGHVQTLREAIQSRRKVAFDYADLNGAPSSRSVCPLGCFFWGKVWTLATWCDLRNDFRSFRVDRISQLVLLDDKVPADAKRTLPAFLRHAKAQAPLMN